MDFLDIVHDICLALLCCAWYMYGKANERERRWREDMDAEIEALMKEPEENLRRTQDSE